MKNKAFTLAEVLITLAIIGVIAAITIPSIVANHQKRTLETQFAKAYRTLSQAVNLAIAEHGDISTWDWKDTWTNDEKDSFVEKYFLPYLSKAKFCPSDRTVSGCMPNVKYKYLNGSEGSNYSTFKRPQVLLADGTSLEFFFSNNCITDIRNCLAWHVDINGHNKPNTIGMDYFAFEFFQQTSEFLPFGVNIYYELNEENQFIFGKLNEENKFAKNTYEQISANCLKANSDEWHTTDSWSCTAKMVMDGFKMNY